MKSKIVGAHFAVVGILALPGFIHAQDIPASPSKPASRVEGQASAKRAIGEVTSVDAKTGKLLVRTAEEDLSLSAQASAVKKTLESIKVGDRVNVSYRDQGGILVADSISKSGAREGAGASRKQIN